MPLGSMNFKILYLSKLLFIVCFGKVSYQPHISDKEIEQVETKLRYTVQVSDMLLRTSFTFIPRYDDIFRVFHLLSLLVTFELISHTRSSKHLEENSPLQSRNPEETHIWLYCFHIIAL